MNKLIATILKEEERKILFAYLKNELTDQKAKEKAGNIIEKLKRYYFNKKEKHLKTLYERFPLKEGKTEEDRKKEIDEIVNTIFTKEQKGMLYAYLNRSLMKKEDKTKSESMLAKLKRYYTKGVRVKKTIYERFPLKEGKTIEERKKEVDNLINTKLTEEERKLLYAYLNDELEDKKIKKSTLSLIARLRYHYFNKSTTRINRKNLYERFPIKEGETKEKRKARVDELVNTALSEEQRRILFIYLNNELMEEPESIKARNIIIKLQRQYLGKHKSVRIGKKNLYERFPIKENKTTEDRKSEIDNLVDTKLTEEERNLLYSYLNDELIKKEDKTRAKNIIVKLKKLYSNKRQMRNRKNIYERFPIKEGKTEEDRNREVDNLIKTILSDEERKKLYEYFNNELSKENNYKKVLSIMVKLKSHYTGKTKSPSVGKKSLYDRFLIKEGKTEEDRKTEIDKLVNTILTEEERKKLHKYFNNELSKENNYKKVVNVIVKLQRHYYKVKREFTPKAKRLEWLSEHFNIQTDISADRFELLKQKLTIIEYQYRVIKGLSDYGKFSHDTLIELICNNPNETLETLITKYIEIVTNYLNEKEDKQTL